jgi:hypothetical protein
MEHSSDKQFILPAIIISSVLFVGVFFSYVTARQKTGTVVLPGGVTYLGPTPTSTQKAEKTPQADGKIYIPADATWKSRTGAIFPYSFMYPETLSLGVFPNDPYDAVTVFYNNTDANANIFFRVENLTTLKKQQYIGKPMEYASTWWQDYSWEGVEKVSAFTNSSGLKGYRATYRDSQGNTPYDHIFLEVPGKNHLIIWMSGRLFAPDVFDRMANSVSWSTTP